MKVKAEIFKGDKSNNHEYQPRNVGLPKLIKHTNNAEWWR